MRELSPAVPAQLPQASAGVAGSREIAFFGNSDYLAKHASLGFENVDIESIRACDLDGTLTFLSTEGIDVDAIAPQVEGKLMNAFIRARKPLQG